MANPLINSGDAVLVVYNILTRAQAKRYFILIYNYYKEKL